MGYVHSTVQAPLRKFKNFGLEQEVVVVTGEPLTDGEATVSTEKWKSR